MIVMLKSHMLSPLKPKERLSVLMAGYRTESSELVSGKMSMILNKLKSFLAEKFRDIIIVRSIQPPKKSLTSDSSML